MTIILVFLKGRKEKEKRHENMNGYTLGKTTIGSDFCVSGKCKWFTYINYDCCGQINKY